MLIRTMSLWGYGWSTCRGEYPSSHAYGVEKYLPLSLVCDALHNIAHRLNLADTGAMFEGPGSGIANNLSSTISTIIAIIPDLESLPPLRP